MKRILSICGISMAVALVLASCTEGNFEGMGGGGNLVITGLSGYSGMYIAVSGTSGTINIGFKSSLTGSAVIPITGGSVSAPVYNQSASYARYTGSDTFTNAVITIYKDAAGTILNNATQPVAIHFYSGSAWL